MTDAALAIGYLIFIYAAVAFSGWASGIIDRLFKSNKTSRITNQQE